MASDPCNKTTTRQTRDEWNPSIVLQWAADGITPSQTWESVAIEAAHRIVRLQEALLTARDLAKAIHRAAMAGLS